MDRNLLLAFALSFLVLSLWSWSQPPPPAPESASAPVAESAQAPPLRERAAPEGAAARYPELAEPQPATAEAARQRAEEPTAERADAETVTIETELVEARFSSLGAALVGWKLREDLYTDRFGDPILLAEPDDLVATSATPFLELKLGDLSEAVWEVVERRGDGVHFRLRREGVVIDKSFIILDSYAYRLHIEVNNGSENAIAPAFLVEIPIQERSGNDFREQSAAALYEGELEQTPLAGLAGGGFWGWLTGAESGEPTEYEGEVDWAGVNAPYFLMAHFPDQPAAAHARFLSLSEKDPRGIVQIYFDPVPLGSGQREDREYRAYLGPKETARLEAFAPSAVEAIDLGWSWVAPLTRGFGWLLAVLYSFVPNYGVAIILLTVLVRLVTAPLTMKQMKSMERMRKLQPKLKEIQEKHADDRQKQSEAMMALYRQEKVNPLGGCFPMLLQLPVFIGLFYALRSSIALRQAPFFGWITDLSAPEELFVLPGIELPVRVLPIVMGASMVLQQKITPMQTPDPTQAKMMMTIMPVMMLVLFYQFPSGLVLYWMMSNLLAIGHQLWIRRGMQASEPTKKAPQPKPAKG